MSYQPYLYGGLNSLEDVLKTFTVYSDGGYWVKKIDKKEGFFREIVEGPYKKDKAEEIVKLWKVFFDFKGLTTANIYKFFDLACNYDIDEKVKKHIHDEYVWRPPSGIELFCLLYRKENAVVYKKENTKNKEFIKFWKYAESNDIVRKEIFSDIIYYNSKNYKSIMKAELLEKIIRDYAYRKEEKYKIIKAVINDNLEELDFFIPDYITQFFNKCLVIYLDYFKCFIETKNCKNIISKIFKELTKCLPDDNHHIDAIKNKEIRTLHFLLLINKKDYKPKKFILTKIGEEYELKLYNDENNFNIILKDIKNCSAKLYINFPKTSYEWENFTKIAIGDDERLANFDSLTAFVLYIAKCIGIEKVTLIDKKEEKCTCDNSNLNVYIEIINLLAGRPSVYKKLGFQNNNKEIIKYQQMLLRDFLNKKIEEEEEDVFLDKNLKEIANLYLEKICRYPYGCQLMYEISNKIYDQLNDKILSYKLDLKYKNLAMYRKLF